MRVKLKYKEIQEIRGGHGMSVVILTDEQEQRALTVVCDAVMTEQFRQRLLPLSFRNKLLPEVLVDMLRSYGELELELNIYDVDDGEYKVTLTDKNTFSLHSIRMSDAVLLNYIAGIPIYIDKLLMDRQCSILLKDSNALAIPINTISTERLTEQLQQAIDEEDYRKASYLYDEIKSRKKKDE